MTAPHDIARALAGLDAAQRDAVLGGLSPADLAVLERYWPLWARPDQLPPPGDWRTWLLLGGRGSGKTRSASEWVRAQAESGRHVHIGIIGPTSASVRSVMVEGPSGILACSPDDARPSFEPSMRRLVWPNNAVAHLFSAEEPDRLRGPNLSACWCDEMCAWPDVAMVWDMLSMALRLSGPTGDTPRVVVSTTPRPSATLRSIIAAPSTVITRAKTTDNAKNLDAATLRYLQDRYAGTRLGRQELDAEILDDAEGALWTRAMLDETRVAALPTDLRRVVIGVDPSGSSGRDETGIIGAGIGRDGRGYVLADASGQYTPDGWGRAAVGLYRSLKADRIIAERNYGGEMVAATLRAVDPSVPVKLVTASRGKAIRAEPIAALYEQRRVHHVGAFPGLEDQMCSWAPDSNMASPDRLDALVWALTELMSAPAPKPARFAYIDFMSR